MMARSTPSAPNCSRLFPTSARNGLASRQPNNALDLNNFHVKFDYIFSPSHRISVKYLFGDSLQNQPAAPGTPQSVDRWPPTRICGIRLRPRGPNLPGVNYTWTITPNSVLESRFGYQRFSQRIGVNNNIDPNALGINTGPLGANPSDKENFGVPTVYYLGYFGGSATPSGASRDIPSSPDPTLLMIGKSTSPRSRAITPSSWWAVSGRLHQIAAATGHAPIWGSTITGLQLCPDGTGNATIG